MHVSRLVLAILIGGPAATASAIVPELQMPPPIVVGVAPPAATPPYGQVFVTWTVREVHCAGGPAAFTRQPAAMPTLSWAANSSLGPTTAMKPVEYSFTIDPTGRPIDIKRLAKDYSSSGGDLAPALAVSRFAPDSPRTACSLTMAPDSQPIATAPVASVMAYTMFPQQRPTPAMWARIKPAGSDCYDPVPQVRNRAFPDFDALPRQPGRQSWSMISFDIDENGTPVRLRPVAGNGNAALDAASLKAVAESRFAAGARTGCQYPYSIGAGTVPPPPMAEEASFRPTGATCPAKAEWAVAPALTYPENFRRRGIEGWAMIGYDVAPWGATGNVRIFAAQPSEEFGEQAMRIIATAKRVPSAAGYTGCTDRVLFKMGPTHRKPGAPPVVFDPPEPVY